VPVTPTIVRDLLELNLFRRCDWELRAHGCVGDGGNGCFIVPYHGAELCVIASNGGGWDHLSISLATRCPTWEEMEHIRKMFARAGEVWLQYGLPPAKHINAHPYCLHWWRPQHREVKLPPSYMVA